MHVSGEVNILVDCPLAARLAGDYKELAPSEVEKIIGYVMIDPILGCYYNSSSETPLSLKRGQCGGMRMLQYALAPHDG